ncbi:MAG: pilus assembly protein PilM [Gammaproteobacteria bacterium]|nr:pilus assembly protein PilM [Gammaproteobacteria bacterium]
MLQFFGPQPLVGLDISSTSVKLLELSRHNGHYRVEGYAVEPIATGAVIEKSIASPEAVGLAIQQAVRRSRTSAKHAAVAVAGSNVITKIITLPATLNDDDMATQIELEADHYIPYPLEEVNLDFEVIGPSERDPGVVDVLLAASRRENVDMRVSAVELGGLTAKVVDVEAYAAGSVVALMAQQMKSLSTAPVIVIFDIGATMTSLTVLDQLKIVYTREQGFGGKQLTEEIQSRYGLSYEEAGRAKRQGGLPEDYETEVLIPFKQAMAQQIARSLQFFFSSSQYNSVDHILLAGGNALIPGIAKLIEAEIGATTSIANPFVGMTLATGVNAQALANDAPALLVACGLALRSFD